MKPRLAQAWLRCYRPSGSDDRTREIRKALEQAKRQGAAAQAEFEAQVAFDRAVAGKVGVALPPELEAELDGYAEKFEEKRHHFRLSPRDPAMLAVTCSAAVIIGLVVWMWLAGMDRFEGIEEVAALAREGDQSRLENFEAVEAPVGALEDWFLLQGFDGFKTPAGFEEVGAVGVRTMEHEGASVAMIAVPERRAFFYVFPARAFGVDVRPEGAWRISEYHTGPEPKSLAVLQDGQTVFMITFAGTKAEMAEFIRSKDRLAR